MCAVAIEAESLGEIAKKEKERRKTNDAEARVVIDEDALETGRPADATTSEPDDSAASSLPPVEAGRMPTGETRSRQSGESLDELGRKRSACSAQYAKAQDRKRRLEAEFQSVRPVTEIRASPGTPWAPSATVQGQPVSCRAALANKRENRAVARRCEAIADELKAVEAEIRRTLACIQGR